MSQKSVSQRNEERATEIQPGPSVNRFANYFFLWVYISSYVSHSIFEQGIESIRWKRNETLSNQGNVKVLFTFLIIYSKLMNFTPHSEVLLGLITCLCRSDTSLWFVASGSSKIKSNWKTYACSEISMIFYKWQGEQTKWISPTHAWDALCQTPLGLSTIISTYHLALVERVI